MSSMDKEKLKSLMENIPDTYDDFVNCTVGWMLEDDEIQNMILTQLQENPESNTSDILETLLDCLGIGEPLELVDDEDEEAVSAFYGLREEATDIPEMSLDEINAEISAARAERKARKAAKVKP